MLAFCPNRLSLFADLSIRGNGGGDNFRSLVHRRPPLLAVLEGPSFPCKWPIGRFDGTVKEH